MSKSNLSRRLAQVVSGTLHAGVDLALEKNVVVVINEKAERLDHFSFPQDRGGYDYFLRRLEGLRRKYQAPEVGVAMEPSNYFWKLLARELEEKKITYHLVNAYTVKKHREGDQLDRSKDDRRDAGQIAELSRNGNYTETCLQKGAYEALRHYATLLTCSCKPFDARKQFSGDWPGKPSLNYPRYSMTWMERRVQPLSVVDN